MQFKFRGNSDKIKDYDYYSGKYLHVTHKKCSLNKIQSVIPIVFRNGSNYDFRFLISTMVKKFKTNLSCIPSNFEKYTSLSFVYKKHIIRFVDPLKLMQGSIESYVDNLSDDFYANFRLKCQECSSANINDSRCEKQGSKNTYTTTKCQKCNTATEFIKLNRYQNGEFTDCESLTEKIDLTFNNLNTKTLVIIMIFMYHVTLSNLLKYLIFLEKRHIKHTVLILLTLLRYHCSHGKHV